MRLGKSSQIGKNHPFICKLEEANFLPVNFGSEKEYYALAMISSSIFSLDFHQSHDLETALRYCVDTPTCWHVVLPARLSQAVSISRVYVFVPIKYS